jgi:hypothetical protein
MLNFAHRSTHTLSLALITVLLTACTAIPITSMYRLSKMDPMTIDPGQIRVAIRVDESVNAASGNAQITMGYKAEEAGIDETHDFDVQLTSAQTLSPKLIKGMLAGEQITVMSLSSEDAQTMRDFQQRLYQYKADDIDGDGLFNLRLKDLCLNSALSDGDVPLTLFLKTESDEDYIVFVKYELHDLFSDTDSNIDSLPFCEDMNVEDA